MFPNLRLIIGAAIATIALVIVMGSGVLSFRDPYRSIGDGPDVGRPLVQHSMVENPERHQIRLLAYARRNDELQRLLDLPTGPIHAYAPEASTAYTFKVTSPPEDLSPSDEPAAVAEEASPPDTQASTPASGGQSDLSRSASLAATTEGAAEPPVATGPSESAAEAPAIAPPGLAPAPTDPEITSGAASSEPSGNTGAASEVTGSNSRLIDPGDRTRAAAPQRSARGLSPVRGRRRCGAAALEPDHPREAAQNHSCRANSASPGNSASGDPVRNPAGSDNSF